MDYISDTCNVNLILQLIIITVGLVLSVQIMVLSEYLNGKDKK